MKILWHSAAPWTSSGYGRCTAEIATRIHDTDEHEVEILCINSVQRGNLVWHGEDISYDLQNPMTVYPGKGPLGMNYVEKAMKKSNADIYFTHFDTWLEAPRKKIPKLKFPYVSYIIVDHVPVPKNVLTQIENARAVISMSEFAQDGLAKNDVVSLQIPHGVNTDKFYPIDEDSDEYPSALELTNNDGEVRRIDPSDTFVIGMVAANHGDRKNIPNHMEAFKMFLEQDNIDDDDVVMYIHTEQKKKEGYNFKQVQEELGIPEKCMLWPSTEQYNAVGDDYLNMWYNVFDIMINCSMGESWGLTITEAQSAGTPCIVSNITSMPEQLGVDVTNPDNSIVWGAEDNENIGFAPHGLVVEPSTCIWREKQSARQFIVSPENILDAINYYYNRPEERKVDGNNAAEFVRNNYEWESHVVPKFKEFFDSLEEVDGMGK